MHLTFCCHLCCLHVLSVVLGDPSPKVDPGAFSGQRQGWKPPRGPSGSALPEGVHCCETSLGLADPVNVTDLLSLRIFLYVFIAYHLFIHQSQMLRFGVTGTVRSEFARSSYGRREIFGHFLPIV